MALRHLTWLVVCFGCDRVFGVAPNHLGDGGAGGDGAGGELGVPDGAHAPCTFTNDAFVVPGYWWVPSADLQTAVRYSLNGVVEYGAATGKSAAQLTDADYAPATLVSSEYRQHEYPALSADGNQLVVRMERSAGGYDIGIGGRFMNQFVAPAPTSLVDEAGVPIAVSIMDAPSAPTATAPRRMLLTSPGSLHELVEADQGWKRVHRYDPFELGLAHVGSGNLSADGLSVVFVGAPGTAGFPGGQPRIYWATRASLDDLFTTPLELYQPVGPSIPYVSNDCTSLFFVRSAEARSAF